MQEMIERYIQDLIRNSTPRRTAWNVEKIREGQDVNWTISAWWQDSDRKTTAAGTGAMNIIFRNRLYPMMQRAQRRLCCAIRKSGD